jgi:hypothetical protein|tara:strand:+ start:357 stop:518 length:162 start_codon:yes stop_codon:yes gene_type:complete
MTRFEETSCKVLGVILFLLIVIMSLQLMGCTCSIPEAPLEYEYIDEVEIDNFA